ncbi:MAG TPA: FAD-dependent oxidoreductase [Candidatus Korarchaeota archaeon]|nr:FAD-dependent oxidoreductase [Candidatus Korarchaeota archaeon]
MFIRREVGFFEVTLLDDGMEILIVGSGAGGATLAKELSTQGVSVTVLESGRYHKLGTERRAMGFYRALSGR